MNQTDSDIPPIRFIRMQVSTLTAALTNYGEIGRVELKRLLEVHGPNAGKDGYLSEEAVEALKDLVGAIDDLKKRSEILLSAIPQ